MRFPEMDSDLNDLQNLNNDLIEKIRSSSGSDWDLYIHDHLVWSVVARTRAVTATFVDLVRSDNDFVAPMLVRINFEHYLLLKASMLHPDGPDGFTMEFFDPNKQLSDIRDINGKRMTGKYLSCAIADDGNKWALDAWKKYSGFVHFDPIWLHANAETSEPNFVHLSMTLEAPFTIQQVQPSDIGEWIFIMKTVVANVLSYLEHCNDHRQGYSDRMC